ncbi:MAG: tRNA preQ1(34) S-adenosylmethionine ribosyltransferase-isomerase QueA [Gammaproteobacteria bacterium RIFCSPHIGHO2_12_FULL_38_14]|nr:MAG: tRNA preQ1(34) S-adenosylmethionine ribosyltransferase-isomerase QueA [Gammaproteobacteria bacterium RIFCSPHIGHO2_12_FULL_38_14]
MTYTAPSDFDFELPRQAIARYPSSVRSESKLLALPKQGSLQHDRFKSIRSYLKAGDLLIFNDTKVIPARLLGRKKTGGRIEVFLERILDNNRMLAQIRASKAPHPGDELIFESNIRLRVLHHHTHFYELQYEHPDRTILEVIESIGEIPLPPYLHRAPEESDQERYQTVYARHRGSVASPTAGLHFDDALLNALRKKNIQMGFLTLHIGAGTFAPVRVDNIHEHQMHSEYFELSPDLCAQIHTAKSQSRRIIAVGTTSLRALETAGKSGEVKPYRGDTNIFIYPGYSFQVVDALITNFHLPRSTLLMLVCAFGGYNRIMDAYRIALAEGYRFYSYGDAMWIERD